MKNKDNNKDNTIVKKFNEGYLDTKDITSNTIAEKFNEDETTDDYIASLAAEKDTKCEGD